jgi:hypothetical protein
LLRRRIFILAKKSKIRTAVLSKIAKSRRLRQRSKPVSLFALFLSLSLSLIKKYAIRVGLDVKDEGRM